jgi:hypothetical protein
VLVLLAAGLAIIPPAGAEPGALSSSTPPVKVMPAPVIGLSVLSRSLNMVVHKGLALHYSVNEPMAGYIQLLLASSLADRLGIEGDDASGLPAGTAPQRVLATALLVSSRGGSSMIRLKLSKRDAKRLAGLHTVSVTLRVIAHNGSTDPVATTVICAGTLSR